MKIKKNTEMLLFRYSNYDQFSFIDEHIAILDKYRHVWMLKLGKRTSLVKLKAILENGGWLILRSPKGDGSRCYIAQFTEMVEELPGDGFYPKYYQKILEGITENDFYYSEPSFQWFKIITIKSIDESVVDSLVMSKTGKMVNDVIKTTRTAVMFIKNTVPIEMPEVN